MMKAHNLHCEQLVPLHRINAQTHALFARAASSNWVSEPRAFVNYFKQMSGPIQSGFFAQSTTVKESCYLKETPRRATQHDRQNRIPSAISRFTTSRSLTR